MKFRIISKWSILECKVDVEEGEERIAISMETMSSHCVSTQTSS